MVSRMLIKTLSAVAVIATSISFSASAAAPAEGRRIEVAAKKFSYEPSEITIKKGEPVILVLHSEDVPHGVKFKELNLQTDIAKGASSELAFTPTKAGDFVGHCSHFCGTGHGSMTLTLHVTE
jgi:cytochrome c oxidase subunit 2